jgi:hypothetical protein
MCITYPRRPSFPSTQPASSWHLQLQGDRDLRLSARTIPEGESLNAAEMEPSIIPKPMFFFYLIEGL